MQLSTPSSDLREIKRQNELFKTLKAEYDRSFKELTRGQDINQLELRAKKALDDARKEAEIIVSNAKRGVNQIQKSRQDYNILRARLDKTLLHADTAKRDALRLKAEAETIKQEAANIRANLLFKCQECDKVTSKAKSKIKELQSVLDDFSRSIG